MWWWQLLSQSALPRRTSASPSVSVTAGTESPALSPELLELQHHPLKIWTWPHNSPFLLLEFFYYLQFQKLCPSVMKSLTHWYPIISSCPRQRRNSPDPFAACASAWPKTDHERIAPTSSSTWIWTYTISHLWLVISPTSMCISSSPVWKRNYIDSPEESKRRGNHSVRTVTMSWAPWHLLQQLWGHLQCQLPCAKSNSLKTRHKYLLLPLLFHLLTLYRHWFAVLKLLKELHNKGVLWHFLRKQPFHHHTHKSGIIIIFQDLFN